MLVVDCPYCGTPSPIVDSFRDEDDIQFTEILECRCPACARTFEATSDDTYIGEPCR